MCFVLGTAAELIKVYPLIRQSEDRGWDWHVVTTGQSGASFWLQYDDFDLPAARTSRLFEGQELERAGAALRWFLKACRPSKRWLRQIVPAAGGRPLALVVHGDTLSCLLGATYGRRLRLPVVHVEAGLRSASPWQPFPEEICRRWVARLARFHMAPDETAAENLRNQRVRGDVVLTHGNSLADTVRLICGPSIASAHGDLAVVNIHRFENLRSRSRRTIIVDSLLRAAQRWRLLMVLHPQAQHSLTASGDLGRLRAAGVELRQRMVFSQFIRLVRDSRFLITDGGSNQEESHYLGKPCLLLRNTTERREGLGSTTVLSRFDPAVIGEFLACPDRFARSPTFPPASPTRIMLDHLAQVPWSGR